METLRGWEMNRYTLLSKIIRKDLLNSTGKSAEHPEKTSVGRPWKRIDTGLRITESNSCKPKTNRTTESNSTPKWKKNTKIQKKKKKKNGAWRNAAILSGRFIFPRQRDRRQKTAVLNKHPWVGPGRRFKTGQTVKRPLWRSQFYSHCLKKISGKVSSPEIIEKHRSKL